MKNFESIFVQEVNSVIHHLTNATTKEDNKSLILHKMNKLYGEYMKLPDDFKSKELTDGMESMLSARSKLICNITSNIVYKDIISLLKHAIHHVEYSTLLNKMFCMRLKNNYGNYDNYDIGILSVLPNDIQKCIYDLSCSSDKTSKRRLQFD